jgi:hypothetical protein
LKLAITQGFDKGLDWGWVGSGDFPNRSQQAVHVSRQNPIHEPAQRYLMELYARSRQQAATQAHGRGLDWWETAGVLLVELRELG